jgi:hypothetical protein
MIVAREIGRDAMTFGLTVPMRLRGGGGLLAPEGLPLALGMDHQPELIRAVADACRRQAEGGRDWYSHGAMALVGPPGVGRGHAARRLAAATGLPLMVVDASTLAGRRLLAGDAENGTIAAPPAAVTAIAATRCANPLILVEGLGHASPVGRLLAPFLDPARAPRFVSDRLGAIFDLSQVNWLLQVDDEGVLEALPAGCSAVVPFLRSAEPLQARMQHLSVIAALHDEARGLGREVDMAELANLVEGVVAGRSARVPSVGEMVADARRVLPAVPERWS